MSDPAPVPEPTKALADAAAAVFEAAQVPPKPEVQDLESARALGSAAAALARAAEALAVASQRAATGTPAEPAPPAGSVVEEPPKPDPDDLLSDDERRERRRLRSAVPTGALDDPMLHLPPGDMPPLPPRWLERFIKPTFLLSPREETIRAAKIYWRLKLALVLLLLGVLGVVFARPISRTIRGYQATRIANQAAKKMDAGDWAGGMQLAYDAYQLRPTESAAIRAAARAMTQLNDAKALELWAQLRTRKELTGDDLRAYAGIASNAGKFDLAGNLIRELLARPEGGSVRDRTAEIWLLTLQGERERAGESARKLLADPRATPEERVNLAAIMADQTPPEFQTEGWSELEKLAERTDAPGLAALLKVGRRAESDGTPRATAEKWVRLLKAHPAGGLPAGLLALTLEVRHLGLARDSAVADAIRRFGSADNAASLVPLARWLLALGEFERALELVPLETASRNRELAGIHVSALRGLGRWREIRQIVGAERIPLAANDADLQLAIASTRLGEQAAAARRWKRVSDAVSGNATAVIALAETAEQHGAKEVAEGLFRDATKLAPAVRGGWEGLLRATEARADTAELVAVLNAARKALPNDKLMRLNWAHATALIGRDLEEARKIAEALVAEGGPDSLASLTLALVHIRRADASAARAALAPTPLGDFTKLDGKSFAPSQLVVAAAVLAANGQMNEARQLAQAISDKTLRREEKDIVQRILAK